MFKGTLIDMKNIVKIVCTVIALGTLLMPATVLVQTTNAVDSNSVETSAVDLTALLKNATTFNVQSMTDFDPLDDHINVTVTIVEIRALDKIDIVTNPDFYVKVTINNNRFQSNVWRNMKYVEELN